MKKSLKKLKSYISNTIKITRLYYLSNKRGVILLFFCIILVSISPLLHSYIIKLIIDKLVYFITVKNTDISAFYPLVIYLFIVIFSNNALWKLIDYLERISYLNFGKYLEILVEKRYATLGFEHYADPKTNDLLNRVRETYNWRPINFANRQLWILQNVIEMITNIGAVLILSPLIFILIIIAAIPELIVKIKFGKELWNINVAKGSIRRDFWNTAYYLKSERFLQEINIFRSSGFLIKRIEKLYKLFLDPEKKKEKQKFKFSLFASLSSSVAFVLSSGYLVFLTLLQKISLGSFDFYSSRIYRLHDTIISFFRNISVSFEDMLYVNDLFKLLSLENLIKEKPNALKLNINNYNIEFKNVWFKYPNTKKYVLKNFNLKIEKGKKIALIGENGGGKTTLIKLLCRFFDVDKGKISIDGVDLKDINLASWHKCIGVLFQDFNRYAFTVKENIKIGDIDQKYEKKLIKLATQKAQSEEFISKYDKGYDTILSKDFNKGVEPSVGQWQKIALSRAFFRNAPILILDEPTSAIDAKAETEIFKQLDQFEKNKTVIMISHRFSTVRNADRICVIDKGKIVEDGTHLSLLKKNDKYAKLFNMQAKGYK